MTPAKELLTEAAPGKTDAPPFYRRFNYVKNIVLAGFHAVGARLRMDPKSISAVYLDPERRDKRMREMREKLMECQRVFEEQAAWMWPRGEDGDAQTQE